MTHVVPDMLGMDTLVLEYYMRVPEEECINSFYVPLCDFEVECRPNLLPHVPGYQVVPQVAPQVATAPVISKKPPIESEHYFLPLAQFKYFIKQHVKPRYEDDWITARRRALSRQYQMNRRRRLGKVARKK